MKLQVRHLRRKKDRVPVATMTTLENDNIVYIGFTFCSKKDMFKKSEGRERSAGRATLFFFNNISKNAYMVDRAFLVKFIQDMKTWNVSTPQGFRRKISKYFNAVSLIDRFPETRTEDLPFVKDSQLKDFLNKNDMSAQNKTDGHSKQ